MSTPDFITRIQHLEHENSQLRRIHDDERDHLAALREEVLALQSELSSLMQRQEALNAENKQLRRGLRDAGSTRVRTAAGLAGVGALAGWMVPRLAAARARRV